MGRRSNRRAAKAAQKPASKATANAPEAAAKPVEAEPKKTQPKPSRAPRAEGGAASDERPPYLLAFLAGLAVFTLYAITLAPTTSFWDASEYIVAAHTFGIPHPPGNPTFVVLAGIWAKALGAFITNPAVVVNLFSAAMSAGAAACWFLVTERAMRTVDPRPVVRRIGAAVAVLIGSTAYTVWSQSNVNEKVYTLSLFTIALLIWMGFRWRDRIQSWRDGSEWVQDQRWILIVGAFILALSVGNHLMAFLAAPALFVLIMMTRPRSLLDWRFYALGIAVAVLGLAVHLFLPIRAGMNPILNSAAPACESMGEAIKSVLSFGRTGCEDLSASLAREQYAKGPVSIRQAPLSAQIVNYIQYFDWQWARSIAGLDTFFSPIRSLVTLLFAGLGIYGARVHRRSDRAGFWTIFTLFATLTLGLIYYLNFKYGFGYARAIGDPAMINFSEVRERDYFYIVSFSLWGVWAGMGLATLWIRAAEKAGRQGLLKMSPVFAVAFIPLFANWSYADRSNDYAARDFAYNLLMSVEPYGVLFTNGDNDTFPLWYLQEVEGLRRDVTVIVGSYFNTAWYAKQLRDLSTPCDTPDAWKRDETVIICQRPYVAEGAPFADRPAPTRSILNLTDLEIEGITSSAMVLPQDVTFEVGGVESTFAKGRRIIPAEQLTLTVIKNTFGERPIFFSAPIGPEALGLGHAVARQGLVYKLVTPEQTAGMVEVPANHPHRSTLGAYIDVQRTEQLIDSHFQLHGLIDAPHWADPATRNVPVYYANAHYALAEAARFQGDGGKMNHHVQQFEAWMALMNR